MVLGICNPNIRVETKTGGMHWLSSLAESESARFSEKRDLVREKNVANNLGRLVINL